jgi:PAS domain S-box-containing protein
MIDAAGRIVLVNREVERLFGYPREELLGQPIELLVPEQLREHHPAHRGAFFHDPKVRSMGAGRELFGRRKDGSQVPVEIGLTPVATEEGMFVLSSIVDITARKRAEARFRVAVDSSPNGMVMVDGQGTIVLVNREVERLFGYSREELLGQSIDFLVPHRFRSNHPVFRAAFYRDPRVRSMGAGRELFGLRKDGTEVPVEIGLNPIETEDGTFVLSSIVDISARKQADGERRALEEQLRQAQKLEAVGTLAGGVAHDFNNILGAIIGYAELAREALADPTQASKDMDELLKAAGRGKTLVERILRFSRRQETVRRPIELTQVVTEVSQLLRSTLPTTIEMKLGLNPETPRTLADGSAVHQILMNLGTNAAHAMPNGGVLEIVLEPVYVRDHVARAHALREGMHAVLSVRDTGLGMDAAVLARAFEPFFTTKPAGSGSGLGLAMVHGIMRDHDGAVDLKSVPGEGTVVTCFFPAIVAEETVAAPLPLTAPRGQGERILYVDDEVSLADVGGRRLTSLGYAVTTSTHPAEALEHVRRAPDGFELMITDYTMPHMTGVALAQAVATLRPDLPILLLTGYVEDISADELRAAGVHRVVQKPATLQELGEAVHDLLEAARHPH